MRYIELPSIMVVNLIPVIIDICFRTAHNSRGACHFTLFTVVDLSSQHRTNPAHRLRSIRRRSQAQRSGFSWLPRRPIVRTKGQAGNQAGKMASLPSSTELEKLKVPDLKKLCKEVSPAHRCAVVLCAAAESSTVCPAQCDRLFEDEEAGDGGQAESGRGNWSITRAFRIVILGSADLERTSSSDHRPETHFYHDFEAYRDCSD